MKIVTNHGPANELLKTLRDELKRVYGNNFCGLYLYGSYARNAATRESDLDVLIVLREIADYWHEIKRTGPLISQLSLQHGISISPVRVVEDAWKHEDSPFLNTVRRESVAA
jgi:predicted nucleotidyltransferase